MLKPLGFILHRAAVPCCLFYFSYVLPPLLILVIGLLATALFFKQMVLAPWWRERKIAQAGPPVQFYGWVSLLGRGDACL